jgi:hypothetical protein
MCFLQKTFYNKNIHIPGDTKHNLIDHRIRQDARKYMQSADIDVICVISSGSDFCCRREDAAAAGKLSCSSSVKRKHRERLEQGSSS